MPGGRPSLYTLELAEEIASRMCAGATITEICALDHMPDPSTLFRWERSNEEFRKIIARAREDRAHVWVEQGIAIADDGSLDMRTIKGKDGEEREVVDHEHIQRSRLRVETRLKLAGKHNPAAYGDKIQQEITGKDGGPIEMGESETMRDLARKVGFLLSKGVADGGGA